MTVTHAGNQAGHYEQLTNESRLCDIEIVPQMKCSQGQEASIGIRISPSNAMSTSEAFSRAYPLNMTAGKTKKLHETIDHQAFREHGFHEILHGLTRMNETSNLKADLLQPAFTLTTDQKTGASPPDFIDNSTSFLHSDAPSNYVYNMVSDMVHHPMEKLEPTEGQEKVQFALKPCMLSQTTVDNAEESCRAESQMNILKSKTASLEIGTEG